ncbi:MAG: HTTM domain-containing protein [Archangiaceae bacterium]|nr:HTTM domain-containing protein [Archangiaceae bacterium]
MTERLARFAAQPVDVASLWALRVALGLVLTVGQVRLLLSGWVDALYVEPRFTFSYWLFDGLPRLPAGAIRATVAVSAALALLFALGLARRLSGALLFLSFGALQLVDVTNYLNHYYLALLLIALLTVLPTELRFGAVPRWVVWLVRLQVAVVYVNAGLGKAGTDWLLHAQPLSIWLSARTEVPVLGPIFAWPPTAYLASWAGFLFDLTIVGWLSWPRTRRAAYALVLFFHALTFVLFDIGMFPFIMTAAATIFFAPSWPRRFIRAPDVSPPSGFAPPRPALFAALAFAAFQVLFPLRQWAMPGDVLWGEGGMRFSWRVMLREKQGSVTYLVEAPTVQRVWRVNPLDYLTRRQAAEMSGQPDLVLQLAHHIARDFERRGYPNVKVRAEAWVSLNGRPPALMIDPSVDLAAEPDPVGAPRWVMPRPEGPPLAVWRPEGG